MFSLPEEAEKSPTEEPKKESQEEEEAAKEEEVVEEEEEKQEMTLDEWKALQEQFKPKKADFKIRRAGEGVDDAQWGDMVALKKKEVRHTYVSCDSECLHVCMFVRKFQDGFVD